MDKEDQGDRREIQMMLVWVQPTYHCNHPTGWDTSSVTRQAPVSAHAAARLIFTAVGTTT